MFHVQYLDFASGWTYLDTVRSATEVMLLYVHMRRDQPDLALRFARAK